jgi:hypothetical protein
VHDVGFGAAGTPFFYVIDVVTGDPFQAPTAGFSGHDPHRVMHICGLDEGPV